MADRRNPAAVSSPVKWIPQIELSLPVTGEPADIRIAGQFQRPSSVDKDAAVEVIEADTHEVLGVTPLMVRIRKDATNLTPAERNRFLAALAAFNNRGMGPYSDFRNVHTQAGSPEAHGSTGFLPWHRAFLLDLERELQAIDPSVALPYWRFDQPAPSLFSPDFMGVPNPVGTLQFSGVNPLQFWVTDGTPGIVRPTRFVTQTQPANVIPETATLALGDPGGLYEAFRGLEGDPHGTAHTSFGGSISSIPTAAKDPLFFLLHANVDRLWAKWQWLKQRFDATSAKTSPPKAKPGSRAREGWDITCTTPCGHGTWSRRRRVHPQHPGAPSRRRRSPARLGTVPRSARLLITRDS